MRLLLDTHVLLWWLSDDPVLGPEARRAIAAADLAMVSTASVWEISLKRGLGKLDAPADLGDQIERHRFGVLPVHLDHAIRVGALPLLHRDPFDRMLVAQAQSEGLTVVTADPVLAGYGVETLAARS